MPSPTLLRTPLYWKRNWKHSKIWYVNLAIIFSFVTALPHLCMWHWPWTEEWPNSLNTENTHLLGFFTLSERFICILWLYTHLSDFTKNGTYCVRKKGMWLVGSERLHCWIFSWTVDSTLHNAPDPKLPLHLKTQPILSFNTVFFGNGWRLHKEYKNCIQVR
jgi:hypothetical protein